MFDFGDRRLGFLADVDVIDIDDDIGSGTSEKLDSDNLSTADML